MKTTPHQPICNVCRKPIHADCAYTHRNMVLCETCCLTLRTPKRRKPHWQYIRSVKTEYLVPGKRR